MHANFHAQEHSWLRAAKRKFEQRDLDDATLDQRKNFFIEDLRNVLNPTVSDKPAVQNLVDRIDEMPTDDFWAFHKTL